MDKIIDAIPVGHENAITISEIESLTGAENRIIRKAIANSKELVINLQDGKGYFKPDDDESHLVEVWKSITGHRIQELQARVRQANQWMEGLRV